MFHDVKYYDQCINERIILNYSEIIINSILVLDNILNVFWNIIISYTFLLTFSNLSKNKNRVEKVNLFLRKWLILNFSNIFAMMSLRAEIL